MGRGSSSTALYLVPAGVAAAGAAYWFLARPWFRRWSSTPYEFVSSLPGDELMDHPRYSTTRSITIDAPPSAVWPWLMKLGQGWSGIEDEVFDDSDVHNGMESSMSAAGPMQAGDIVRLAPNRHPDISFVVDRVEDERHLIMRSPGDRARIYEGSPEDGLPDATWAFVLEPLPGDRTRVVVRFKARGRSSIAGTPVNLYALEPVHFFMERTLLRGIKRQAERAADEIEAESMESRRLSVEGHRN
ncbi:MAG: hypothetical protein FJ319_11975 [SAR202 cluster bacterium]|nr:hypothetical protein [SAR202 cluster bacterium]